MQKLLGVLAVFAVLGTAATASWATPPGKNGDIVFRRYLDTARTTGALFVASPTGKNVRQLTRPGRGVVDQYGDWSPDGKKLVFERKLPCPAGGSRDGLDNTCDRVYVIGRDGRGLKPLVPCGFDVSKPFPGTCVGARTPSWSPDGSMIAFRYALDDDDYRGSFTTNIGIWVVRADGTGRRQVTQLTPGTSWDLEPQWSPDGKKLVFVRNDLDRKAEAIFTVSIDGSGLFQVTPWTLDAGGRPDWSPDGKWILFRAPSGPLVDAHMVHPDGTGLMNLTKGRASGHEYLSSTFSPDGKKIVSARTPGAGVDGAADVVIMSASGSNIRPITRTRLWESSVDWGSR